jgi:acetoin utilization protein AcuB
MRVRDVMTRDIATIEASEPAHAAISKMLERKIRHLPVLDASGALVGIVTDRDLRHHLFTPGVFGRVGSVSVDTLLKSVTVKQLMSSPAVSVAAGEELEAAAYLMLRRKIGSLPVVDSERVIGIVTETDLLRQVVRIDARTPECEAITVSFP